MILVDFSPVVNSALYVNIDHLSDNGEIQVDLVRHMVFDSLRKINNMHSAKYGKMVICFDSGNVWRKDVLPEYKANRAARRDDMEHIDWDAFYAAINQVESEVKAYLPYLTIKVDRAEADDIIGTLAAYISHTDPNEKILIASTDGDFQQLQKFGKVAQWSTMKEGSFVRCDDPKEHLLTKILKGDTKDGVPNFRSSGDFFVKARATPEGEKKPRQKPVSKKIIQSFMEAKRSEYEDISDAEENQFENFKRNEILIDLMKCPDDLKREIIRLYKANEVIGNYQGLMNFFTENSMGMLLEKIDEFRSHS